MANQQNLDPYKYEKGKVTTEQARKNGRKGGLASAEAKKANKTLAEIVRMWAELPVKDENDKAELTALGIDGEKATQKYTLLAPILKNTKAGNGKALQTLVELLQEDKEKECRIRKLEAETEKIKIENEILRKQLESGGTDYEDLTPLADLLKVKDDAEDDD